MKLWDDQVWMPSQSTDELWSALMFAGSDVAFAAARLLLSVSLPLAAAIPWRLSRCHSNFMFEACCVVASGRSQFGASSPSLKAVSDPKDIASIRCHAS